MDLTMVSKNLVERGYSVKTFETAKECSDYLNSQIDATTVGIGGSVTVSELGLYPLLKEHNTVFWHGDKDLVAKLGVKDIITSAINTEVYISSVNAMSKDGVIINIDGNGNRIASTCYGHKKVYLIVGKNKLTLDFESAMWRARNIASPKNAQRLKKNTPCAVKGDKCYDCQSPERICNGFLIFERAMKGTETEVLLVNEELGY